MTSIEVMKYVDRVLGILHLDPNKVTEVSVELSDIERKISVRDIMGNYYIYIFSLSANNSL
jgi:hypothetical protein